MEMSRTIRCACGQTGTAIWEVLLKGGLSPASVLVRLSGGFYLQMSKKRDGAAFIACYDCGRAARSGGAKMKAQSRVRH